MGAKEAHEHELETYHALINQMLTSTHAKTDSNTTCIRLRRGRNTSQEVYLSFSW